MKRTRQTCNIFCGLAFCHGAKSGRSKGGRTYFIVKRFEPARRSRRTNKGVCGNDDDDNDPISRERERRIYKVALFLQSYHTIRKYHIVIRIIGRRISGSTKYIECNKLIN